MASVAKQLLHIVGNVLGVALMFAPSTAFFITPLKPIALLIALVAAPIGLFLFRRTYRLGFPISPDFWNQS